MFDNVLSNKNIAVCSFLSVNCFYRENSSCISWKCQSKERNKKLGKTWETAMEYTGALS